MAEAEQRAAVVAEAKTWLGTPFRNCADVKGAGVDCAMLLIRVFADTGIIEEFDPRPYSFQWHMHHDEERFLGIIETLGKEIVPPPDLPCEALAKQGDVIVYKFGRCFAHGALVIDDHHVLHAWNLEQRVTVSPMHDVALAQLNNGRPRPRKLFDPWKR